MKNFSEYMKWYLREKNISFSNAAKMCGMDRTILGRYANGSRRPQSIEVIIKIADGLQMTPDEKKEFYEAYRRTKISEDYGTDYAEVEAVVNENHILRGIKREEDDYEQGSFPNESTCRLHSQEAVFGAIRSIKKGAKYIKIYVSPQEIEGDEKRKVLFSGMQKMKHREQIICLRHREWQYGREKIKAIYEMLPFLLQREKTDIYYFYQYESDYNSEEKYYIVTDKGIVIFNRQMTEGFYSGQKGPDEYYTVLFDKMKMKCRIFAKGGINVFRESKQQPADEMFENKQTSLVFLGQKENGCIWILKAEDALAVCLKESGSVRLLWNFIWDSESQLL